MDTQTTSLWRAWQQRKDEAAFEALVRPELPALYDAACRVGLSSTDAEDVVQEALACEDSCRPGDVGVGAWLMRSVHFRALTARRSQGRRQRHEARASPRPSGQAGGQSGLDVRDEIETALARLSEDDRQVLLFRFVYDLDYRELAYVLGVSKNACRIRVHRASSRLRERLGPKAPALLAALPLGDLPGTAQAIAAATKLGTATGGLSMLEGLLMSTSMKMGAAALVAVALTAGAFLGFGQHASEYAETPIGDQDATLSDMSVEGGPLLEMPPRPSQEEQGGAFDSKESPQVVVVGRVRRGPNPVAGHTVVLRTPAGDTARTWSLAALPQVVAGVADARGEFRLVGRPGPYVLQVGALPHALHLQVSAPTAQPLDIDLATTGQIVVTVRSSTRQSLVRAVAGVRAGDGRVQVAAAGVDGLARFAALPPGRYIASAAPLLGQIFFAPDGPAVNLKAPDTETVEVILSAAAMAARPQPRALRVALPGTADFEGWQARAMYSGTTEWTAMNGIVPVRIMRGLEVRAPDGRWWKIRATDEDMAAGILVLPTSEVLWRGLLLDRKTNKPLVGYTVFARAASSHRAWIGSRTDASGEFEVRVVQAPHISLTFYDPEDVKLRGISFAVTEAVTSSESPIQVRIPLPGPDGVLDLPVRRMTGSVRHADGSAPPPSGDIDSVRGGMISVSARFEAQDGVLVLSTPRHTSGLTASGSYAIGVYEAESYGATIYTEMNKAGRPGRTDSFEWVGFSKNHDFELD